MKRSTTRTWDQALPPVNCAASTLRPACMPRPQDLPTPEVPRLVPSSAGVARVHEREQKAPQWPRLVRTGQVGAETQPITAAEPQLRIPGGVA